MKFFSCGFNLQYFYIDIKNLNPIIRILTMGVSYNLCFQSHGLRIQVWTSNLELIDNNILHICVISIADNHHIDKRVKVSFEMVHKNTLSPLFSSINCFLQCGFKHSSFLDT
jgi:hypothetical protein